MKTATDLSVVLVPTSQDFRSEWTNPRFPHRLARLIKRFGLQEGYENTASVLSNSAHQAGDEDWCVYRVEWKDEASARRFRIAANNSHFPYEVRDDIEFPELVVS